MRRELIVDEKLKEFAASIDDDDDDLSNLDLMPPALFSKIVLPQSYKYQSRALIPIDRSFRQNIGLVLNNGRLEFPNVYRNKFITMVSGDIPSTPSAPSKSLDALNAVSPAMKLCIERLQRLFVARPISTRRAIFNTYFEAYGTGNPDEPRENWRPILRFAIPYVCYMFRSGPFKDAYVSFSIDPRKECRWAAYQTAGFNFRTGTWRNQYVVPDTSLSTEEVNTKSHLFTGRDVGTKIVCFSFVDILDPLVRKVLDNSPLREKFDVRILSPVILFAPFCWTVLMVERGWVVSDRDVV
jgi:general transcription factor 3C polypeptide 5 (transcription factor C subunit 1)